MAKVNSNKFNFPDDLARIRNSATKVINPIKPADVNFPKDFQFEVTTKRLLAGRNLPPYYLVYFLLCELLDFRNLGMDVKVSWSVPIDFKGKSFLIEHRKLGLGIFAQKSEENEFQAKLIVDLLLKGVKVGQPFFDWLATDAVKKSKLNVINNSIQLFERYKFLRDSYYIYKSEAKNREHVVHEQNRKIKEEKIKGIKKIKGAKTTIHGPAWEISQKANWLALSSIEAFFSWTEHVFIHIAIIKGSVNTGIEINKMANEEWQAKFKRIFDLDHRPTRDLYEKLLLIRRQVRNFMAHGAFGKQGEAFRWHSKIGAVPVKINSDPKGEMFHIGGGFNFKEYIAMDIIEKFINFLWEGPREPSRIYIQDAGLPAFLNLVHNGTYKNAMRSVKDMEKFVYALQIEIDRAANMDW